MVLEASNPALSRELRSLAGERDPELLAEALIELAGRQIRAGRHEAAAAIFPSLQGLAQEPSLEPSLRQRIVGRLEGFQGQGSVGLRVEHHLQNFVREATHPATLAGFALGAAAFQSARLLALTRLGASPAGFLSRGPGARFLAAGAGWAAEVPALSLSNRGLRAALGERVDWSPALLGRDLGSTAITLGLLRAAGSGARAVYASSSAFQQVSMLGSLMLAHELESRLGWRPATDLAGNFTDSLVTLLHFEVGGRLFRELQPRSFARSMATMELHSRNLPGPRIRRPSFPSFAEWTPRLAATAPRFALDRAEILQMAEAPKPRNPLDRTPPPAPRSTIASSPFRFRKVVEELPDPIIVTDLSERVVFLNRRARELLEGLPLSWHQGSIEANFRPLEGEEGIFAFAREGGEPSYWRIRSQLIEENEPYRMHQLSDVTQLRQWQEIAGLAEMKANLAEGLVHDAGNLVAAAYQQERNIESLIDQAPVSGRGSAHTASPLILERPSVFPGTPGFHVRRSADAEAPLSVRSTMFTVFKGVREGVRELGSMLRDTVQVFRENQRMLHGTNQVRLLQVQPLLEKALKLNERMREQSGVRLVTDFGGEPPIMMGEEGPLLSAVLNLFINACHAMPKGGELRVRTRAAEGIVSIEVEDTGTGIHPDNLPHIFEPHFTTKEHSGGTGMGLANVNMAIVRVHRGHIEVQSEPGKGTTFRLLLPQSRAR